MTVNRLRYPGLLLALLASLIQPVAATPVADIAVLLPQKGRLTQVGQSIRDGLLAAYYQDSAAGSDSPRLRFYDSSEMPAPVLVQLAVANGATAVIGPLDREQVQALLVAGVPPVPVLALNRAAGGQQAVFQMALSPEDEVATLAQWMHQRGLRRPLLLAQQSDASALRFLQLFDVAWIGLTGNKPLRHSLDDTRKGGVAAAVRDLATHAAAADSLFLASPAIATQVQPALTYYRQALPLFTLSSAWSPDVDTADQQDLDGLGFCGLPWMLEAERPEQAALYEAQPRPAASHDRLYAFGADAWSVLRSLNRVRQGEALALRTGRLQMDGNGHLIRLPTCAEIRHGTATIVFTPEPSEPATDRR